MYISTIILFILGFLAVNMLGRKVSLSPIKKVAFFLLLFANAAMVGNTIRNGRLHATLAMVLFVSIFAVVWWYKDRRIDAKFAVISALYAAMLITHYQETVLVGTLFLSLIFYKKGWKEKAKVIAAAMGSVVLVLWWIIPFLSNLGASSLLAFHEGKRIFDFSKEVFLTNIATIIIPLIALMMWYWYMRQQESKREILFFLPQILLGVAYITRITTLVPILRNISQDPYILFFLFFILFMLFKEEEKLAKIGFIAPMMVIIALVSVAINATITPWYDDQTPLDKEIISLFPYVEGKFVLIGPLSMPGFRDSYSKPLYSYASIYHNLSTPDGWSPPLTNMDYLQHLDKIFREFHQEEECEEFRAELIQFNATSLISAGETCTVFAACNFEHLRSEENACLYRVPRDAVLWAAKIKVPP